MFVGGNGFKVQKIEAKGKNCLSNWEKLKENEMKLGGNGNLGWQKRKKGAFKRTLIKEV